ncbi:hypothetical protein HWV62_25995 [Athelia sp. TMB]|nr:hypothetical protein HWV62_25995 [Athelia sp. TMB]
MGKLNIAHHKSYHIYRRGDIEKVKRDEEEAALKEACEEGRVLLADREARIDLLMSEGTGWGLQERRKGKIKSASAVPTCLLGQAGRINLFEDLEQGQSSFSRFLNNKKREPEETEKGVPLAPSAKDLKPWYVAGLSYPESEPKERDDETWEEKRYFAPLPSSRKPTENGRQKTRERCSFKALNDLLTSITHQLQDRRPIFLPPILRSTTQATTTPACRECGCSRPPTSLTPTYRFLSFAQIIGTRTGSGTDSKEEKRDMGFRDAIDCAWQFWMIWGW